jgi:hypothetical protein
MPLYMDVHTIEGEVTEADVADAHAAPELRWRSLSPGISARPQESGDPPWSV